MQFRFKQGIVCVIPFYMHKSYDKDISREKICKLFYLKKKQQPPSPQKNKTKTSLKNTFSVILRKGAFYLKIVGLVFKNIWEVKKTNKTKNLTK